MPDNTCDLLVGGAANLLSPPFCLLSSYFYSSSDSSSDSSWLSSSFYCYWGWEPSPPRSNKSTTWGWAFFDFFFEAFFL